MDNSDMIDWDPIVEELYSALEGKVEKKTLREDLEKYVLKYRTGIAVAKDSIIKKYRNPRPAGTFFNGAPVTKKVKELEGTEMQVTIVARMVYVDKKTINTKAGPKEIISGILGDDTGTAPFTIWSSEGEFEKGRVYTFKNGYTKKWQDQVQVNIGHNGSVIPNDDVTLPVPTGNTSAPSSARDVNIADITDQTKSVNVTGRISGIESRQIKVKGEDKTVYGGILTDETGRIQFTSWVDHGLKDGEVITAKNAYIRSWKGIPQLNIGDNTQVERSDRAIEAAPSGPSQKTVEDIMKVGGGLDLSITGTIVDVRGGSGLIKRCPQCNRSVLGEECSLHGRIEPVMDLRLKLTIDDGTGAISAIINRKDTESLTGITLDMAIDMAKEKGDMSVVADRMSSALLLKKVTVTGNVMSDEYGPQMSVRGTELATTDVQKEAEELYSIVEGSL